MNFLGDRRGARAGWVGIVVAAVGCVAGAGVSEIDGIDQRISRSN